MKTTLKFLGNAVWILLILSIVYPVGWFVWRAGQPMEMPQFNGLTYRQYMAWQKMAYHELAVKYHEAYPDKKMGGGLDMCYNVELGGDLLARLPLAGLEALAGVFPGLKKVISPKDWNNIPEVVTLQNFLPNWWTVFEKLLWNGAEYQPHTSVPYCRLRPDIPTPEEFDSIKTRSDKSITLDRFPQVYIKYGLE